jgi:N-acetyl-gamma-glutamyl-phosphate reductase
VVNVFIDGQAGTTGLQIAERLRSRSDIDLLEIPEQTRKDPEARREYLNKADLVILCLPDEAAREAVNMVENRRVRILDASSAHRTHPDWVYGLPELVPGQRKHIAEGTRVSNPGCYPTGFLLALAPLVKAGFVPADYPITVNAVSGFSGGGRKMIEQYRQHPPSSEGAVWSCRKYGLKLVHKHLPEMKKYAGLRYAPLFEPAVADVAQGMLVSIPLVNRLLKSGAELNRIWRALKAHYDEERVITVFDPNPFGQLQEGFLGLTACNDSNRVELFVFGNTEQTVVIARLDNLGKGAAGAAIQNMNLMLGISEFTGLTID